MPKKQNRDGEFIYMVRDSPEFDTHEYVRGHISGEQAAAILGRETGNDFDPASAQHVWMRRQFPSHECPDGCDFEFRELATQQRGAFKVTKVLPLRAKTDAEAGR